MSDFTTSAYDQGAPPPDALLAPLEPWSAVAYAHHVLLAAGERWATFTAMVEAEGADPPEFMDTVARTLAASGEAMMTAVELIRGEMFPEQVPVDQASTDAAG